jgi:hypothetical protein
MLNTHRAMRLFIHAMIHTTSVFIACCYIRCRVVMGDGDVDTHLDESLVASSAGLSTAVMRGVYWRIFSLSASVGV